MGRVQGGGETLREGSSDLSSNTWFHNQLGQISAKTHPRSFMAGGEVENTALYHVVDEKVLRKTFSPGKSLAGEKVGMQKRVGGTLGPYGFRRANSAGSQSESTYCNPFSQDIQRHQSTEECAEAQVSTDKSRLVGKMEQSSKDHAYQSSTGKCVTMDGCLSDRLRGPYRGRLQFPRVMDGQTSRYAHKRKGTDDFVDCPQNGLDPRQQCHNLVRRQCSSSILCAEERFESFQSFTRNHDGYIQGYEAEKPNSSSTLHTRSPKRDSRLFVKKHSDSIRMGIRKDGICAANRGSGLDSGSGRDGDTVECEVSPVRMPIPSSPSSCSGFLLNRSEQMVSSICLSPGQPDFEGFEPLECVQGKDCFDRFRKSTSTMVSNSQEQIKTGLAARKLPDTEGTGEISRSLFSLFLSLSRLDFLNEVYSKDFGPVIASRLTKAWRSSTQVNYNRCWREFQSFVKSRGFKSISQKVVLEFLEFIFTSRNLAPKTVLTYRNALAKPLEVGFGIDTSNHIFSALARAQFIARPSRKRLMPAWDLDPVLEMISSKRYTSEKITLEDLLKKTLFLTCLATGNRGSEIAALLRSGASWRLDGSVIFPVKPGFLFKNESLKRAPPNVLITPLKTRHVGKLCPVKNLQQYLKASEGGTGDAVFLHPKTGRNLQRPSISLFITTLIEEACPGKFPRLQDLRKQAVSLAWTRGISPADIVAAVSWSSSNVFIKHYLNLKAKALLPCVALCSE